MKESSFRGFSRQRRRAQASAPSPRRVKSRSTDSVSGLSVTKLVPAASVEASMTAPVEKQDRRAAELRPLRVQQNERQLLAPRKRARRSSPPFKAWSALAPRAARGPRRRQGIAAAVLEAGRQGDLPLGLRRSRGGAAEEGQAHSRQKKNERAPRQEPHCDTSFAICRRAPVRSSACNHYDKGETQNQSKTGKQTVNKCCGETSEPFPLRFNFVLSRSATISLSEDRRRGFP